MVGKKFTKIFFFTRLIVDLFDFLYYYIIFKEIDPRAKRKT